MNDDIRLALLGDHEAAKRLTEEGVLLQCPFCGGEVALRRVSSAYSTSPIVIRDEWTIECPRGCVRNNVYKSEIFQNGEGKVVIEHNGANEARLAWNTRAAVEMEGME